MDDTAQAGKKDQKSKGATGCCGSTPGLQIMDTIPVQESSEKPCCGNLSGDTAISDSANSAGTAISSIAKSTAFWIWGFTGLAGITILVVTAGIVPDVKPEVFWRHVLSNLGFVGKNIWSILPFFILSVGISAWVTVSGVAVHFCTS